MLLALGAASTLWDALQSLTSSSKASSVQTASQQNTSTPFEIDGGGASLLGSAASGTGASGGVQISPQTMSALIAAQSQSGASGTAPTDPSQALKDLFSQINVTGDGAITKQELEQALGAGGTNIAAADDVFNKLDTNGDGTVSLDELKSALQGAGHHGHHHMHGAGSAGGADGTGSSSSDPLLAAIAGASETSVTNADGSTTTSITYADGSKVSLTTAAASSTLSASSSATSSYNLIEQLIQREAQALFASTGGSVSVHA